MTNQKYYFVQHLVIFKSMHSVMSFSASHFSYVDLNNKGKNNFIDGKKKMYLLKTNQDDYTPTFFFFAIWEMHIIFSITK